MAGVTHCYACRTALPSSLDRCPQCGAEQTASARAEWRQIEGERQAVRRWKLVALFAGLGLLLTGLALWTMPGRRVQPAAPAPTAQEVTIDQVNDAYLRMVNEHFAQRRTPLQLLTWLPSQGGIVFEMNPPTRDNMLVVWQAVDSAGRRQIMEWLSINYTVALLQDGVWPAGATTEFPRMELRYRGVAQPLAIRHTDGRIEIRASPYDHLYAPLLRRVPGRAPARQP